MKKMGFPALAVFLAAILIFLGACQSKANKVVSYEIDPAEIKGSSVTERMDSLVSLLNEKTIGFSKVTVKKYEREDRLLKYLVMVYGDAGNDPEKFEENSKAVLKQLFAWSVKFVDPDTQGVGVSYILSDGSLGMLLLYSGNITTMKSSPPEAWNELVEEIPFKVVPADQ